jgi:hypothetical protein
MPGEAQASACLLPRLARLLIGRNEATLDRPILNGDRQANLVALRSALEAEDRVAREGTYPGAARLLCPPDASPGHAAGGDAKEQLSVPSWP